MLIDVYSKLNEKDTRRLHLIESGNMCHAFNEDALVLSAHFGYKVTLHGSPESPYLKASFNSKSVKYVAEQLSIKLSLASSIYKKTGEELKKIQDKTPKKITPKTDYIDQSHIASEIQKFLEYRQSEKTALKLTLNDKKSEKFQLHLKAVKLQFWFNLSVSKYMPSIYRNSYGIQLLNSWLTLVHDINKLRNISHLSKEAQDKTKGILYSQISSTVDTLKDIVDAIYAIKGWKNAKQYHLTRLRVDEIGRIIGGLKLQLNRQPQIQEAA